MLLDAFAQGRRSGEQAGWLTEAQIRAHFRAKADAAEHVHAAVYADRVP